MGYALDMHRIATAIEQQLRLLAIVATVVGRRSVRNGLHDHMTVIRQRALDTDSRRWIVKAKRLQIDAVESGILGYGSHVERGEAQVLQLVAIAGAQVAQRSQRLLHAQLHAGGAS